MNRRILLACVVILVAIAGCVPEKYQWSPDGQTMTVLSNDGLRFADPDGKLQPAMLPGVSLVSWFPDSHRILVGRAVSPATWADLVQYLTPEQIQDVTTAAGHARDFAMQYDWTKVEGENWSWSSFAAELKNNEEKSGRDTTIYDSLGGAVATCFRDHRDAALTQKIPAARWDDLANIDQDVFVVEVDTVHPDAIETGPRLMTSLRGACELRVSPKGQAAIVVIPADKDDQGDQPCELWVAATDASRPPIEISTHCAWYPDWTADGRDVVFVQTTDEHPHKGDTWLGSIDSIQVVGDDGKLMKNIPPPAATQPAGASVADDPDRLGSPTELAGLICNPFTRVRCLADGRIFFACVQVTLPATGDDFPQHAEIFSINPGKEATVSRVLTRNAVENMGDAAQYFEVSPDAKYISVPDHSGKVTVVDLAGGNVMSVQPNAIPPNPGEGDNLTLPSVPTWRGPDELTFVAPNYTKGLPPYLFLYNVAAYTGADSVKPKVLSVTWPDSIMKDENGIQPSTQPSTQPATAP
ncbi:MAG: hypothetical protein ABSH22_07190 [Tepidisphaeraceae bacterium]|jgi:hypothetical protein